MKKILGWNFRNIIVVFFGLISIILMLPLLAFLIFVNVAAHLSRPSDLEEAKNRGSRLADLEGETVMMVGAHPDDVDWYCGGALSVLHKKGNRVVVVVATSGEKGGMAKNLAQIREKEQLEAAKIMGYDEVEFLRFPDKKLKADNKFVSKLSKLIAEYNPSVIFTFDMEKEGYVYHHPDHRAANIATLKALENSAKKIDLYYFHSRKNNVILDMAEVQEHKIKALKAHASQRNNKFGRVVRYFPFSLFKFPRTGAAQRFAGVDIEYGEMFRKAEF